MQSLEALGLHFPGTDTIDWRQLIRLTDGPWYISRAFLARELCQHDAFRILAAEAAYLCFFLQHATHPDHKSASLAATRNVDWA